MSEKQLKITPPRSALSRENIEKLPVPVKAFNSSKNKIYQALLSRRLQLCGPQTSTPDPRKPSQRVMAAFTRLSDDSTKSSFHSILDNDSGYVSHHHESNFDSSSENLIDEPKRSSFSQSIFISEDALLEKPEVNRSKLNLSAEIDKEDYAEASRLFNTSDTEKGSCGMEKMSSSFGNDTSKLFCSLDSVIENSFVSERTTLTGLESDASDTSLVIPLCEDIVVKVDGSFPSMEPPNYSLIDFKEETAEDRQDGPQMHVTHVDEDMEIDVSICGRIDTANNTPQQCNVFPAGFTVKNDNVRSCNSIVNSLPLERCEGNTPEPAQRNTSSAAVKEPAESQHLIASAEVTEQRSPLRELPLVVAKMVINNDSIDAKQAMLGDSTDQRNKYRSSLDGKIEENKENICHIRNDIARRYAESPVKRLKTTKVFMPSPDMFSDCEDVAQPQEAVQESKVWTESFALRCDVRLLRRVQNGMGGVIPPPSVTMTKLTVDDILTKLKEGENYFWDKSSVNRTSLDNANSSACSLDTSNIEGSHKTLLINSTFVSVYKPFPEVLNARFHGLHHNRSKLSEKFEHLCDKYAQRYVGMETQSSCTVFEVNYPSPRKRVTKPKWGGKSPGKRLSHLARRRITFSSANLQAVNSSFVGNRTRQIMIDAKKLELLSRKRSPKKTPKKTPPRRSPIKSRTPSSSAKKKLAMRFRMVSGEIEETYSNCSSVKSEKSIFQDESSRESGLVLPSVADERRRLLSLSSNDILNKKRKRTDSECGNLSKLAKMDMKSTREEMKSALSNLNKSELLSRSSQSGDVTEMYKKKLQWSVYEALRSQNITSSHAEFKTFASTLARVIRRFLPTASTVRPEDFNEKMLKLARYNVYAVIKGKTVDEIIADYMKAKQKQQASQRQHHNLSHSSFLSQSSQSSLRNSSDTRSSLSSSSSSNKENVFRTKSPVGSSSRSHLMLRNSNCSDNRINRIRKVINFGDDNR